MSVIRTHFGFVDLLEEARSTGRPVVLDGAVGTELDNRGADTGSPLWSGLAPLSHAKLLREIHEEYVEKGAQVITTCTFRTTGRAFDKAGQPADRAVEAIRAAVGLARGAAGGRCLVAGSVGPLEDCFSPWLAPLGTGAQKEHATTCRELVRAGVDLLWLETFGTVGELRAAIRAAGEATEPSGVPFVASVVTRADGDLISGEPIGEAMALAADEGACAFGVNCVPSGHVDAALLRLLPDCALPVAVYANLGRADPNQDWQGSAYLDPDAYAGLAADWVRAGVRLVGGCCGSSPDHIRALVERLL